jgi:hypothetical protein
MGPMPTAARAVGARNVVPIPRRVKRPASAAGRTRNSMRRRASVASRGKRSVAISVAMDRATPQEPRAVPVLFVEMFAAVIPIAGWNVVRTGPVAVHPRNTSARGNHHECATTVSECARPTAPINRTGRRRLRTARYAESSMQSRIVVNHWEAWSLTSGSVSNQRSLGSAASQRCPPPHGRCRIREVRR